MNLEKQPKTLEQCKDIAISMGVTLGQNFVLLTGTYRIEYHEQEQLLITEERQFDRIDLKELISENH